MSWNELENRSDRLINHVMNDPYFSEIVSKRKNVLATRYQADINVEELFPKDRERELLTNGVETIVLSSEDTEQAQNVSWAWDESHMDAYGHISAAERIEYLFDKYAAIKATAPEKPVYLMHNHPTYDKQSLNDPSLDKDFVSHHHFNQESDYDTIGSIPSSNDVQNWLPLRSLVTPAIYHQRENVVAAYIEDMDVAHSTHIVLEHNEARFSPVLGNIPESYSIRLAAEGDNGDPSKGDVTVPFEEWPTAKEKYGDKLTYFNLIRNDN